MKKSSTFIKRTSRNIKHRIVNLSILISFSLSNKINRQSISVIQFVHILIILSRSNSNILLDATSV
jgi:hypothetical protein